jgi:hypothetical protein
MKKMLKITNGTIRRSFIHRQRRLEIAASAVFKGLDRSAIQLMPSGSSPDGLSGIYTRGRELSCRYRITFTELKLKVSILLNLGISNGGVVVHLR